MEQLPRIQGKTHSLENMTIAAPDMHPLYAKTACSRIHVAASLTKSKG